MIDVTCAIIRNEENEVLIVQRGPGTDHPLRWEFPGGKINTGETAEDCIIREIAEELSMDIVIVSSLVPVEHDYGFRKIRLMPFICDTLDELPLLSEHVAYRWVGNDDLLKADFSEADIPVARQYLDYSGHTGSNRAEEESVSRDTETDTGLREIISLIKSSKDVEWIARSAAGNPALLTGLVRLSFSDDTRLAFHSSWALTKVGDLEPGLLDPHLGLLIEKLGSVENESVQRSFLRILSLTDMNLIDSRAHGLLADHCFGALRSGFSAIAVKAYSMDILYKLAVVYPGLRNELVAALGILEPEGKAGLIARARQIMRKL